MFDKAPSREMDVNRVMGFVSTSASILAGCCMLLGFILSVIRSSPFSSSASEIMLPPFARLLEDLKHLSPIAFMGLGLLILAFIPILRVLIVLLFFLRSHNFRYVIVCLGVLFILAVSMLMANTH